MQRHLLAFYKVAKQRDNAPLRCKDRRRNHKNKAALQFHISPAQVVEAFVFLAKYNNDVFLLAPFSSEPIYDQRVLIRSCRSPFPFQFYWTVDSDSSVVVQFTIALLVIDLCFGYITGSPSSKYVVYAIACVYRELYGKIADRKKNCVNNYLI